MTQKITKLLTSAAIIATSFAPAFVMPAQATIIASSTTTATQISTCNTALGANIGVVLHDGSPSFTTEVVETGQIDGATTEVSGSRVETAGSRFGTGTVTYSGLSIVGDPFRNGGSVNMFGDQVATNKNWSNSEYDFTADYSTTTTISYNCDVTEQTEVYHPAVHIPGQPVQGYYTNNGTNSSNGQGSCQGLSPTNPHWGEDLGNCTFTQTADAVIAVDEPEYWTLNDPISRPDLATMQTVDETNVANENGHEINGGAFTEVGTWLASKVVICISPKRLPGIWTNQNGYTGTKCNTTYFNSASWGGGSQTSNGTYISVPGV